VPWRLIPKTPKDLLLDIFVEFPALLEDVDCMLTCTNPPEASRFRNDITRRCWQLETELLRWREEVKISDLEPPLVPYAPSSPPLGLIATTHILCVYWSMFIIIYSTLRVASRDATKLPARADPAIYCRRIAEVVSILLHPDAGVYGIHLANFPTAVALLYLNASARDGDADPEEKRMILEALQRSANGRTAGRFITSTQKQDPSLDKPTPEDSEPSTPRAVARSWLGLR